jgi:hypothetical protein
MQLCIIYLLPVRRQENKVFSAPFAVENTRFQYCYMLQPLLLLSLLLTVICICHRVVVIIA